MIRAPLPYQAHAVGPLVAHWVARSAVRRLMWHVPLAVLVLLGVVALAVLSRSRRRDRW